MVLVDAYIKFPEVVKMTNTTAKATVNTLRDIFSRHGLLVSDNAPQSASKPSPNGQAERVVQILKSAIKQAQLTNNDISAVTAQYLLVYGNTPHSTTDEPPALPVMGRRPSTCLDLLIPSIEKHVEARRYTSKVNRTTKRGLRQFSAGNPVLARNYGKGEKWVPGVVTEVVCSRHCMV